MNATVDNFQVRCDGSHKTVRQPFRIYTGVVF